MYAIALLDCCSLLCNYLLLVLGLCPCEQFQASRCVQGCCGRGEAEEKTEACILMTAVLN